MEKESEEVGKKYDSGKLRWNTMQPLFKELEQVVQILDEGIDKYSLNNWQSVKPFEERYSNALMRHVVAYMEGEYKDQESGHAHLAHAICNCLFLMWGYDIQEIQENGKTNKDRVTLSST